MINDMLPLWQTVEIKKTWNCQIFVDTNLSNFYKFNSSNWEGERYPNEESILLML